MRAFDKTVYSLCEKIDDLEADVAYWKGRHDEVLAELNQRQNDALAQARLGVRNSLMFALSASEAPNGDLVFTKEKRAAIAEMYRDNAELTATNESRNNGKN